jgi:hypothetical protein
MQKILDISKIDDDYTFTIHAGTTSTDIEIGLASLIVSLTDRERKINPSFNERNIITMIERWIEVINNGE